MDFILLLGLLASVNGTNSNRFSQAKNLGHPSLLPDFHLIHHETMSILPSRHVIFLVIPFCRCFSSGLVHCHHLQTGVSGSNVLPDPPNCSLLCIHSDFPKVKI